MSSVMIPPAEGVSSSPSKQAPSVPSFLANSEESERRKASNRLEFLKNSIQQTNKQTHNACCACYNDLSRAELLAFDCMLADFLLTDSRNEICSFVKSFARPAVNLLSYDRGDRSNAENRASYLVQTVQRIITNLRRQKDYRIEQPKHASEVIKNVHEIIAKLDQDIKQESAHNSRSPSRGQSYRSMSESAPITPAKRSVEVNVPHDFSKWMNNNIALEPGSSENAELRSLFCSVSARYQSVSRLREQVELMKASRVTPMALDYQMCGLESIKKSPFLTSVQSNYKFLQSMLMTMRKQRATVIPQCEIALQECLDSINSVAAHHGKLAEEVHKQASVIAEGLKAKKEEAEKLRKELLPYALAMSDIKSQKIVDKYATLSEDVIDEIKKALVEQNHNEQIKMIDEIAEMRRESQKLCMKSLSAMENAAITITPIYKAASDNAKTEQLVKQNAKKFDQLKDYERRLDEMHKILKVNEVQEWATKVDEITAAFTKLHQDSERLEELTKPLTKEYTDEENEEFEKEIQMMEERTQELLQEKIRIDNEIADAKVEYDNAAEKLYSTAQDLAVMQQVSHQIHSENEEKQMMKLQKLILCPCCKKNRRNCLIATCMHPICKSCMEHSKGVCPICKASFTKKDIKPFYFQN